MDIHRILALVLDIHLLVLISFTMQVLLFFAGRFQMRVTDKILRIAIWFIYLGADGIAKYALSSLSRQEDIPQSLAFFWAPFLLTHLGGQDTITAFVMEDNNLWLRHVWYLMMNSFLVVCVLWKSLGRHSWEFLVSDVFVFVAGIIKFGEKIWSLKSGSFENLENSTGRHHYEIQLLQEVRVENTHGPEASSNNGNTVVVIDVQETSNNGYAQLPAEASNRDANVPEASSNNGPTTDVPEGSNGDTDHTTYSGNVRIALLSMLKVHDIFAARNLSTDGRGDEPNARPKVVELQLGMMHDDLYTKSLVLRTRTGLVLRCISIVSAIVAFALFHASDKERYREADIAISYSLFIGGFFLELCAVIIFLMSPWTWAWFKFHRLNKLADFSWFLFSSGIGWPQERPRWSNSMGQCNNMHMLDGREVKEPQLAPKMMLVFRKLLNFVSARKDKITWLSKIMYTEYIGVDEEVMECIVRGIDGIRGELDRSLARRGWPHLCSFPVLIQDVLVGEFGGALLMLHMVTDGYLNAIPEGQHSELQSVCRKLSNYMMYLMVNHPSILPLNTSAVSSLDKTKATFAEQIAGGGGSSDIYDRIAGSLLENPEPSEEVLQELADMWTRVLLYAAGRSRAELHAARLASGGELITIVWLLMANQGIGDSKLNRIRITNYDDDDYYDDDDDDSDDNGGSGDDGDSNDNDDNGGSSDDDDSNDNDDNGSDSNYNADNGGNMGLRGVYAFYFPPRIREIILQAQAAGSEERMDSMAGQSTANGRNG